ncbi:MAG: hypothetical protein LBD76_01235 [Prevotellaceae bacterium]|jgi:hypothetical protein|nr:hypothetical protein [Prevotellaceae bacterium]
MKRTIFFLFLIVNSQLSILNSLLAQEAVFAGADETSVSRAQYFTWINNTNEGTTEKQTLINLDFFEWLRKEYGMKLDIYAFDSGIYDGKNFYGTATDARHKRNFPNGFDPVYEKATQNGIRLGIWGGPDGFGDTTEEAAARKELMVALCRNYNFELFKFDAVCGPLRKEKEDDFIDMMKQCRTYSPDLILLNHRLGLDKAKDYATTFLWEGKEAYIDVNAYNTTTAPHNRAGTLSRGLTPQLKRLTEDHGVCLSSCLDYWEDDLILQAFNRSLILAPEIYGNPWLLADDEFPRLARIFNLHRKFGKILINAKELPASYGKYALSRGDDQTRLLTLRNLTWNPEEITVKLNEEIGLNKGKLVKVRLLHPSEKLQGNYKYGESVNLTVPPFRSVLLVVSTSNRYDEVGVEGVDFEIVRNIPNKPVVIKLLGFPASDANIRIANLMKFNKIEIDGQDVTASLKDGKSLKIKFAGDKLSEVYHRKLAELKQIPIPGDVETLYEATVFAADNNAMEVRSLHRSGTTKIPQVQAARDAFFEQSTFVNRGIWDRYLFDGNKNTRFYPSRIKGDNRIKYGCFRFDLGEEILIDSIVFKVNNEYELQPLLFEEGNFARISSDLKQWKSFSFLADTTMKIVIGQEMRYLKLNPFPDALAEVEVYSGGQKLPSENFRASNLFADTGAMKCEGAFSATFTLNEVVKNAYLCVAINGEHGVEGAYAALKIGGKYLGAPSRATSYRANHWEYPTVKSASNYTYFFPLTEEAKGKKIEVFVLAYNAGKLNFKPEVWLTAYPAPFEEKTMLIY